MRTKGEVKREGQKTEREPGPSSHCPMRTEPVTLDSLSRDGPLGSGSAWGEASLSALGWPQVKVHRGRQRSRQPRRSEAVAARHALSKAEDREAEAEKQQERGKDEEAGTVLPMRDLSPRVRKAGFRWPLLLPILGSCIQGP